MSEKGPLVVSYGAGVNTIAALIGMRERGIVPDATVFSDTKGEKPETYEHMRGPMADWCDANGFPPITEVNRYDLGIGKTGDRSLEDECLRLGTVPSRAFGYGTCADKWKIDPFKHWVKTWPLALAAWERGGVVTRVIGYDASEERRIGTQADKGLAKWFPLIEWGWDRDRCIDEIQRAGLPVPPKSACFYCPSSTKTEIVQLALRRPELMGRALAIEDRSNASGRWSVKGLGRRFAWRSLLEATNAQRELFEEAPVESCTKCADDQQECT